MHKGYLRIAAFLGALSVTLGAFAAHKLKTIASEYAVGIFETGVRYQFYHVFAVALVAILYYYFPNKLMKTAGLLFLIGILFFSGSLYLLTYKEISGNEMLKFAGPVTPLGGVFFIAGWVCLALGIKSPDKRA